MSMTRKDYVAFADVLATVRSHYEGSEGENAVRDTVDALSKMFKADNPRFDEERFKEASGFDV